MLKHQHEHLQKYKNIINKQNLSNFNYLNIMKNFHKDKKIMKTPQHVLNIRMDHS